MASVKIRWSDVWLGSAITAVLFWAGRYLFGVYVAKSVFASLYGAAGTFLVVLLWYYFLSLILLLGAECTYVYATRYGSHVQLAQALRSAIEGTTLRE
jgi:membrane protein